MIKVYKSAALVSTATGYDLYVMERAESGKTRKRKRTFPSAASMRRYYRLSKGWSNYSTVKAVPWANYWKIFENGR